MVIVMKGCLSKEKDVVKEHTITQQVRFIKEDGLTEELKVMVCVLGQMEKNTMDNGKITKNMVQGHTLGLMVEFMKVTIGTIKNMVMELIFGLTVENI